MTAPQVLFSEAEIGSRVEALAQEIAPRKPEIAIAILIGGFVFASDLVRALARVGVHVEVEFLWLRSYGNERAGGAVSLLAGPSENVKGKRVLLLDGAGATEITTAVAVDKSREDAIASADFAGFSGVGEFVVGYGMDEAGKY